MAEPFYRVNGFNILPYLDQEGLQWEENDLDSDESGRTLDGMMHRTRVAIKDKHTLKCRPLKREEAHTVLQHIALHAMHTVSTNVHPKVDTFNAAMYNSSRSAGIYSLDEDNNVVWKGITFTLIQQ